MKLFKRQQKISDGDIQKKDYNSEFEFYETLDFTNIYIGLSIITLGIISLFVEKFGELFLIPSAFTAFFLSFADFYALKPTKIRLDKGIHAFCMFCAFCSLVVFGPLVYEVEVIRNLLSSFEKPLTLLALGITIGSIGMRNFIRTFEFHQETKQELININKTLMKSNEELINKNQELITMFMEIKNDVNAVSERDSFDK
jgi:hypothetical protein